MNIRALIRTHFKAFSLHSATGIFAVLAHYSVMFILLTLDTNEITATSVGFFFGASIKYYFSHTTIFPNNRARTDTLIRFSLALLAQAVLNGLLLKLFLALPFLIFATDLIDRTWLAQILSTGTQLFTNYIVYRYWVFSDKKSNKIKSNTHRKSTKNTL